MRRLPWIIRRRHPLDDVKMPQLTLHERIMQDGKLWHAAYNAGQATSEPPPRRRRIMSTETTMMSCESCPIEMPIIQFADLVANGWNMKHSFQNDAFNDGQVIRCTGKFHVESPLPK